MIKYNLNTINDWFFSTDNIIKVYRNGAVVYYKLDSEQGGYKVCYAVVEDITQYTDREFEDVYDKATEKWFKLNNLSQYEEYGVYASGRTITYYEGKLTIDDGYEYEWNGSSWVNVGEVSGSTATLPDIPFVLNYNAKDYDATTHSIPMTSGQLNNTDAVAYNNPNNIVDHSADGYITISNSSMRIRKQGQDISLFNRQSNSTSSDLTIVCKAKSTNGENIITNRDSNYNWMYRLKTNGILAFHGNSETGSIAWNTSNPDIMSVRTYYDSGTKIKYNNWTQNTSTSPVSFSYGSTNTDSSSAGALFVGYSWTNTIEQWEGDFYWVYMAQANLTDAQIQEVIDYNERGGGQSEYPIYYDEIEDPLDNLTFSTLAEAQAYAEANCVYDGMHATIDSDRYYFDSNDENGWVKILEYYKFEDVTPGGASGWTISGSSTYNPDSSYYDDFDLETTSTSNVTKIAKITIYGYDHFTYYLRSYNYWSTSYSIVMASNIDELSADPTSMSYNSNSAITNTYNFSKTAGSAVNLSNYRRVTYNNLDKTVEHTFYVVFNGRTYNSYVSNATILIPKEQTNENWEQVTFSASSNVASTNKNLYIDGSTTSNGGTQNFYYRWMIGLPSGSHTSYTNYGNYDYCPNVTSSTFTSVAGEQRQVNFTYDYVSNKSLSFRLTDGSNVLTPSDTVYYNMTYYNSCGVSSSSSNVTFPRPQNVKVGGRFRFANSSNRHYIYGYSPNISLNTDYYADNYQSTFDITYTKLSDEAVTITYTTYDPSDVETPAFKTEITWPYSGGTTSSTTLTSFDVPYTYPYKVSQTSDKFSADSQSYTANQAARTINFVLYPDKREFATISNMEAYQYAWEGMKAYVGDTNYEYKNGEWVEYTGTIWLDPSATNALFSIGHYWGENYKMVFTTYLSGSYSGDYGSFWQGNGHTPIELSFYSNGFYYDFHNPTSTTAPDVYTGDYSWRIMKNSTLSNYENGQILNIILSNGAVRVELESTGAAIVTGSTSVTAQNWYSGLYLVNIGLNNDDAKCHLSHIQIYNGNNELVNDFKFIKNNGVVGSQEISVYDSVTNTTYNNTNSNTPVYHIET